MRQPLEMILSFRLEDAAYCIVVVKNMYGLVRGCLRACAVRMHMPRAFMYLHNIMPNVTPLCVVAA